jgi:hypothetical protein
MGTLRPDQSVLEKCNTVEELENNLKAFKQKIILKENSIALILDNKGLKQSHTLTPIY